MRRLRRHQHRPALRHYQWRRFLAPDRGLLTADLLGLRRHRRVAAPPAKSRSRMLQCPAEISRIVACGSRSVHIQLREEAAMVLDQLRQMARAVEDAWAAPWAALGQVQAIPRTIVDHVADPAEQYLRVYTPGMPEMLLNLVMCYRAARPIGSADIERVIAPFRQHRLPFQWWVTPG